MTIDRKVRTNRLGTAVGLYVAFCVLVGLGNVISALGRGEEVKRCFDRSLASCCSFCSPGSMAEQNNRDLKDNPDDRPKQPSFVAGRSGNQHFDNAH